MKKIAVIGSGTMGTGIAHIMAQYGLKVSLIDLNEKILAESKRIISINTDRQIRKGVINENQKKTLLSNILFTKDFNESVKNVELVVEAIPENFELKKKIIKDLDLMCKDDVIISSNTSSLSISSLADKTHYPDRIIGMHFMNPVPVMPLVEIVVSSITSEKFSSFLSLKDPRADYLMADFQILNDEVSPNFDQKCNGELNAYSRSINALRYKDLIYVCTFLERTKFSLQKPHPHDKEIFIEFFYR